MRGEISQSPIDLKRAGIPLSVFRENLMKKSIFVILAFILVACAPQQVTVTSAPTECCVQVSVTLTPTETPISPTPTTETMTLGGVTMTVGKDGVVDMDSMKATGTEAEQAEKLFPFDATNLGFAEGETVLMMVDGKLTIVDADDHARIIAQWGRSETMGRTTMLYDFAQMVGEDGENVLLEVGWVEEMKGRAPADVKGSTERDKELYNYSFDVSSENYKRSGNKSGVSTAVNIFSEDRSVAIQAFFKSGDMASKEPDQVDRTEGVLCFRLKSGLMINVAMINFEADLRNVLFEYH